MDLGVSRYPSLTHQIPVPTNGKGYLSQLTQMHKNEQDGTWCFHGLPLLATHDPQG